MNETALDDSPAFARGKGRRGAFRQFAPCKEAAKKGKRARRRSFPLQQHQNDAVDDACKRAEDDDRPCDDEHFCRHAGDEALCLCQDRDEGNFCPILLGFWLLKFLKKSVFFAKLL